LGSAPGPAVAFTLCGGARNGRLTSVRSGQGVEALLRTIPKQGLHESFSIWQPFRPGKKGVVALVFPAETGLGLAQILAADRDSREILGGYLWNPWLAPKSREAVNRELQWHAEVYELAMPAYVSGSPPSRAGLLRRRGRRRGATALQPAAGPRPGFPPAS